MFEGFEAIICSVKLVKVSSLTAFLGFYRYDHCQEEVKFASFIAKSSLLSIGSALCSHDCSLKCMENRLPSV